MTEAKEDNVTGLVVAFLDQSVIDDVFCQDARAGVEATVWIKAIGCRVEDDIVTPVEAGCFEREYIGSFDGYASGIGQIELGA